MHSDFLINGEKAPSATELTRLLPQDWLWAWYQREVYKHGKRGWQLCKATSNRAMRLGTHTHGFVEMALTGKQYNAWLDGAKTIPEPERRLKLVKAWAKALEETTQKDTVKYIEKKVFNTKLLEHGTVDAIVEDDEMGLKIVDWKTSGSIGIDYPIQLAIYARCYNKLFPESLGYKEINFGEIQRVDKDLKSAKARSSGEHHVQVKRFDNLEQYYPVIDALHVIWDYCNKAGKWKIEEKKEAGV